jgi:hypothetical protein
VSLLRGILQFRQGLIEFCSANDVIAAVDCVVERASIALDARTDQ